MVDNNETIKTEGLKEFTKGLQSSLFATRETVEEAYTGVHNVIKGSPDAIAAVQILLNTIASHIERNYIEKGEDNE